MKTTRRLRLMPFAVALALLVLLLPGCNRSKSADPSHADSADHGADPMTDSGIPAAVAVAELAALGGSGVTGRVIFTAQPGGQETAVVANVQGLSAGDHGFHVHEKGDCGDAGKAAGGHFNPGAHPHGALSDAESHAGDLGNLTAAASGAASSSFVTKKISVAASGPSNIVGRAVIVHEKADDLASQPTGAAGGRVACGVIVMQEAGPAPAH